MAHRVARRLPKPSRRAGDALCPSSAGCESALPRTGPVSLTAGTVSSVGSIFIIDPETRRVPSRSRRSAGEDRPSYGLVPMAGPALAPEGAERIESCYPPGVHDPSAHALADSKLPRVSIPSISTEAFPELLREKYPTTVPSGTVASYSL